MIPRGGLWVWIDPHFLWDARRLGGNPQGKRSGLRPVGRGEQGRPCGHTLLGRGEEREDDHDGESEPWNGHSHNSISSSARASTDGGMVRPKAFAVLRFT